MGEVRSLNAARAIRERDNTLISPLECLEDAANDLRAGKHTATSALVLTLDTTDGSYCLGFYASNLKASEMVSLCEAMKHRALQHMGIAGE